MSVAYLQFFRPWQLRWGATADEVGRTLPGDDVVADPTFNATRAITIAARPDQIWPWLLQVGVKRAGWYSYDILDNLGRPSSRDHPGAAASNRRRRGADEPRWPPGDPDRGPRPAALDDLGHPPRHDLAVGSRAASGRQDAPHHPYRSRYRWLSPTIAFSMLIEFTDIWMIRKMLLNLRERAEALAQAESRNAAPPRAGE